MERYVYFFQRSLWEPNCAWMRSMGLGRVVPAFARLSSARARSISIFGNAHRAFASAAVPQRVDNVSTALRLLRAQPAHYVVASIAGRTMLLSESDLVTLPRIRNVEVGDVLELDRVHEIGSRDYTLRAQDPSQGRRNPDGGRFPLVLLRKDGGEDAPTVSMRATTPQGVPFGRDAGSETSVTPFSRSWAAQLVPSGLAHVGAALSPEVVKVRCVVTEHAKGPMERIVKFKRRKGYEKTITHKQPYTRLRVDSVTLGSL